LKFLYIELARSDLLKDLRGIGLDEGDVERRFRLLHEPESLAKYDFNDIVLETEFDSNDVPSSLQTSSLLVRLKCQWPFKMNIFGHEN